MSRRSVWYVAGSVALVGIVVFATQAFEAGRYGAPPAEGREVQGNCANSTSDSTTLNGVITASRPGDRVIIRGTCLLTATIELLERRTYQGGGRSGTRLVQADNANLPVLVASDSYVESWDASHVSWGIVIRDLNIDGNRSHNTAATNGIVLRSWLSTIDNTYVTGVGGSAIYLTDRSASICVPGTLHRGVRGRSMTTRSFRIRSRSVVNPTFTQLRRHRPRASPGPPRRAPRALRDEPGTASTNARG